MSLAQMLYKETGKKTGVVYATGMIKGRDVRRMAEDCRAQETIPATAQGIYDKYINIYQKFLYTEDPVEAEMLKEDLKDMERKYGIGE
ncbi:hypothetical protein Norbert_46 [Paenibacillus phage Norbert]|uniref:hypothetical protein n=1 Tax=Paenibacillus larvae TaxID=1464 RepID=UPI0003DC398A|nr:hypothetical protein [Paenibacillus larvae]ETK30381.1 hypothetical protein ERIC1_1c39480 [Paenibacillus larvae subsp. larvae DSM 25719]QVV20041.1 hypothetical protein Norbert_46 [Paenibacillus phage Norbert]QVV20245.1 hypothetical protein Riker_47 [Paenibacillus phage Riker]